MDAQTLLVYESRAAEFCARYRATEPRALYGLIEGFFLRGAPTADVGCGSGRDVAWLSRNGFPCVGYDGSPAMIAKRATRTLASTYDRPSCRTSPGSRMGALLTFFVRPPSCIFRRRISSVPC